MVISRVHGSNWRGERVPAFCPGREGGGMCADAEVRLLKVRDFSVPWPLSAVEGSQV